MKLISFSVVRNESDIIEVFVRYHARLFDRMVIVDHRSDDNTWEILNLLKDEGMPIDLRQIKDFTYDQGKIFSEVVREMSGTESPDWMIALDGDEFLVSIDGRDIRKALESEPAKKVLKIPWRGYVLRPEDDVDEKNALKRIGHRRTREDPQWWKLALPSVILKQAGNIWLGTHDAYCGSQELPAELSRSLAMAHFPVRSAKQLKNKAVAGWLSTRHFYWKYGTVNNHWKYIYDLLMEQGAITPEDLKNIASQYASERQWQKLPPDFTKGRTLRETYPAPEGNSFGREGELVYDPVNFDVDLRYPVKGMNFQKLLLKSAQELAEEFGKYLAKGQQI